MNKRVSLSYQAKRKVFRLLADASLARHLSRECAALGTAIGSERAAYYRAENRRFLSEARCLVQADLKGPLSLFDTYRSCVSVGAAMMDRREEARNAPVQVSVTPAFRRLSLLCVLVQAGKGRTSRQPLQCLPRLRAPWAPLSGQWPLVLPAPLRLRAVQAQAPTLAQLDRCVRYRQADPLCSYPRGLRTGVAARLGGSHVIHS